MHTRMNVRGRRLATAVGAALSVMLLVSACTIAEDTGGGDVSENTDDLIVSTESQPPTTSPGDVAGKTVYWLSCGQAVPACSNPPAGAEEAAALLGIDFHVIDGALNAADGYLVGLRQAIAASPDAIIVHGVDCALIQAPLAEAAAAGIHILGIEGMSCTTEGVNWEERMQFSETSPTDEDWAANWGTMGARAIIKANPEARIINNEHTFKLGQAINKAFVETIDAECPKCEIVDTVSFTNADLSPNGPWINAFRSAVLSSDADTVWFGYTVLMTGLGGNQAIAESGKDLLIVGGDGSPELMDLIRDGTVYAGTGIDDRFWMGWGGIDAVARLINGEPQVPEGVTKVTVTQANVDDVAPSGSDYVTPIDYKAAYKKAWGVE